MPQFTTTKKQKKINHHNSLSCYVNGYNFQELKGDPD